MPHFKNNKKNGRSLCRRRSCYAGLWDFHLPPLIISNPEGLNSTTFSCTLWTTFTYTLIQVVTWHVLHGSNAAFEQHLNITWKTVSKAVLSTTIYVNFHDNWNVPKLDLDISHHCGECLEVIRRYILSLLLFETMGPKDNSRKVFQCS
jgi:hypothetical protein